MTQCVLPFSLLLALMMGVSPAAAQNTYRPGVTDTEIKIGNIMPYSGPLSAYALNGRAEAAYFRRLNDQGGINGRRIKFISYDDGFSPPKRQTESKDLMHPTFVSHRELPDGSNG